MFFINSSVVDQWWMLLQPLDEKSTLVQVMTCACWRSRLGQHQFGLSLTNAHLLSPGPWGTYISKKFHSQFKHFILIKENGLQIVICEMFPILFKSLRGLTHFNLVTHMWRHRSGSTSAQVMAWCLTTPSHNLNLSWHITKDVLWHSTERVNFTRSAHKLNL